MAEGGILLKKPGVALISGEIVKISPTRSSHVASINGLIQLFVQRLHEDSATSIQNPVQRSARIEP